MRVALLASPFYSVPPINYGPTEAVVAVLATALRQEGHEVILVGVPGPGQTHAPFHSFYTEPQTLRSGEAIPEAVHIADAADALRCADVIHDHTVLGPLLRKALGIGVPSVTTVHGPFNSESERLMTAVLHAGDRVTALSAAHLALSRGKADAFVHHGLSETEYRPNWTPDEYLLYLGRLAPEKGLDLALLAARQLGIPLKVAAKVTHHTEVAYARELEQELQAPNVTFLGEIGGEAKAEALRGAACLLFPSRWAEPFGLSVIEALASGTPVAALRRGSLPELIDDGRTGALATDEDEFPSAVMRALAVDRHECRRRFEKDFTATRMSRDYVSQYELARHA